MIHPEFKEELILLLDKYEIYLCSGTDSSDLAEYLIDCLLAYNKAIAGKKDYEEFCRLIVETDDDE